LHPSGRDWLVWFSFTAPPGQHTSLRMRGCKLFGYLSAQHEWYNPLHPDAQFRLAIHEIAHMEIDDTADTPFAGDRFFVKELWFLLDIRAKNTGDALHVGEIHEILNRNRKQEAFKYVPLFTEKDLAFLAADSMQKLGITVIPFQVENLDQLEKTFEGLIAIGRKLVGFDPGENRVETIPIGNLLESIRRKKRNR
jgi:hypothetical protein